MADITLSKAVRSNLLNLQSTATQLGKTQERLATGLKVNSALDNPSNFFTASSLNARAGDLGNLLDAVSNATQTLEAADNGITAIQKLVESAQATARQALQTTGAETTNVVTGSSSATFDPAAFTTVSGDNSGTGALAADAVASIQTQALAEDSDITFTTANIGGGDDVTALDTAGTISNNDSLSIEVDGTAYTVTFSNNAGTAGYDAAAVVGNAITLDTDGTITDIQSDLDSFFDSAGISVNLNGNGTLTFTADSDVDVITIDESVVGALGRIGLSTVGSDNQSTAGSATDRLLTRNSEFQAFIASAATTDGQSIAVALGGTNLGTVTIGTGVGEVNNKDDFVAALDALSDINATSAGGADRVTIQTTDSTDNDSAITFTASASEINTFAGFDVTADDAGVDLDSQNALVTTALSTNLINQGAVSQGNTIDITVGSAATLTVTFGTGANEVSTLGELNDALAALAGGSASADTRGEINITSDNAGEPITIGGTTAALTSFGLTAGEASSLIDGTNIVAGDKLNITIGTNSTLTVTFGTGSGQVNTLDELETALANLAGGTATIDDATGAITIEATNGSDSIVVDATDSLDAADAAVAASFGLTNGTQTATTADSTTRATLESQYNELLSQIDELAEDAGFNGVNLLDGDDLSVIFNEDGSSTLEIDGVSFNSTGLGLSSASSGQFQADANINNTLTSLDAAASTLRSQASKFGSNLSVVETRQDFTKNMINTLETGAANLTLADTNEEAANLLALQTRQQLSSTALSLASQADQNVLRLF